MKLISAPKRVDAKDPVFDGHFPGHPILPGVFLLGFAREAISISMERPMKIVRVLRQRFMAPVLPNTEITVECVLTNMDGNFLKAVCKWRLPDGTVAARGELVVS
jgi:3-hydroxyacyl-[acyl-carrier-protein] dehydratase